MSALLFLAIVLVVFVLGAFVIYFRNRDTSTGDASIDSFRDEMGALGPMLDRRRSHGWGDRR